jgi:hypothetical protein
MTKIKLLLVSLFLPVATFANDAPDWLENTLFSSGKMNTVIAVVLVILIGILIWLFIQDKRIKRLEEK